MTLTRSIKIFKILFVFFKITLKLKLKFTLWPKPGTVWNSNTVEIGFFIRILGPEKGIKKPIV